ncbi:ATP-dependent DNA ligase Cdc17 [Trifolium repens]|nr:DNA ligase [Trifolium repens]WJX65836.1 ATP-dependent DNA ligase Cdc17 [Trifolium repens]
MKQTVKVIGFCPVVNRLKKTTVSSFVLDCELVAYDRAKRKILTLQELSTRARKDVGTSDIEVNVCIFAFDLLYLNGQTLLQEDLKIRKEGDTLDLGPIGAYYGSRKRKGFYGSFLLACYDNGNEEYQTICKVGTGFSDKNLKELFATLRSKVILKPKAKYRYNAKETKPDVWFEDCEVFEVKASDLNCSSEYPAAIGLVNSDKGISLRGAGLVAVRIDKAPNQATSSEQVAEMYKAQEQRKEPNKQSNMTNEDEDIGD